MGQLLYHPDHSWQSSLASSATACRLLKICLLVYKCFHQLAAPYLITMISPVSATRRHLRSAGQGDLVVPRTRTAGFGPWSFSVVEQTAAGNQDDITDTRTVLWPAENWNVSSQLLRVTAAIINYRAMLRRARLCDSKSSVRQNRKYFCSWNYNGQHLYSNGKAGVYDHGELEEVGSDCDSDRKPEIGMSAKTGNTYISGTTTDSVKIPTNSTFLSTGKVLASDRDNNGQPEISARLQDSSRSRRKYIFGCRSLSQLFGHTFIEFAVVKNHRFAVAFSIVAKILAFAFLADILISGFPPASRLFGKATFDLAAVEHSVFCYNYNNSFLHISKLIDPISQHVGKLFSGFKLFAHVWQFLTTSVGRPIQFPRRYAQKISSNIITTSMWSYMYRLSADNYANNEV